MKTYKIEFKKAALKFLGSRSHAERVRLFKKIHQLPGGEHIKKLATHNNRYRLRVGDFRVIYELYDERMLVLVIDIGNRGDVYK